MLGVVGRQDDRRPSDEAHRVEVVVVGITGRLPSRAHEERHPSLLIDSHQVQDHPLPAGQLPDEITTAIQEIEVTQAGSGGVADDLLAIPPYPDIGSAVVDRIKVNPRLALLLHHHRALTDDGSAQTRPTERRSRSQSKKKTVSAPEAHQT